MALYSDLNQSFDKTTVLVEDERSVRQSIIAILKTPIGTRFFQPEFGSRLEDLLFDPLDPLTALNIRRSIFEAIQRWEPRVIIDSKLSSITPNEDENKYDVIIAYKIKGFEGETFKITGSSRRRNFE